MGSDFDVDTLNSIIAQYIVTKDTNNNIKGVYRRDRVKNPPTCIILDTVKGKGIPFMEEPEWHAKAPNKEEYNNALKELGYESN